MPVRESTHYSLRTCIDSGVAIGVAWGQSATPDSEKFAKNREKIRKNREKIRKNREKEENREEKAKIGKFLSLCPT